MQNLITAAMAATILIIFYILKTAIREKGDHKKYIIPLAVLLIIASAALCLWVYNNYLLLDTGGYHPIKNSHGDNN